MRRIGKCGLMGESMPLNVGFEVSETSVSLCFCLLLVEQDAKPPGTALAPCLSTSHHDDCELTL